jgi:uncharacterized protein (TIGR02391 family)
MPRLGQHGLMTLPVPSDPREAAVLNAIFVLFRATGRWPAFADLDRYLDAHAEPDSEGVLLGMGPALLYGVAPHTRPLRNDQPVGLTLAGLAACEGSDEDVSTFLGLVGLAATIEAEREIGSPEPTITPKIASDRLRLPAAGRSELLDRAGEVLATEPWGWTGYARDAETSAWSFSFDRRVRRFRAVDSIERYWSLAHPAEVVEVSMAVEPEVMPPAASAVTLDDTWIRLLHPEVRAIAESRLAAGHADNAVEEAWKVVAAALRELSGLDHDGVDLINQAFGSKGSLRFADTSTAQGRSEHEGFTNLMRGLAQAGRNLRAHRPSDQPADEAEVATMLLLASVCLDRIDKLSPTPVSESGTMS